MTTQYSDCYFCGGAVEERRMAREVWWDGRLYVIENVPVGVCVQCGEKVIRASVASALDEILAGRASRPTRTIRVPVYAFA